MRVDGDTFENQQSYLLRLIGNRVDATVWRRCYLLFWRVNHSPALEKLAIARHHVCAVAMRRDTFT